MTEPCKSLEAHPEKVFSARQSISEYDIPATTNFFGLLSGETRMKILIALSAGELCVCDIAEVLQMSPSAVSHQLKHLKSGRLVNSRREGKEILYSLERHISPIILQTLEHLKE